MSTGTFASLDPSSLLVHYQQAVFQIQRDEDGGLHFVDAFGKLADDLHMSNGRVAGQNPVQFFGTDTLRNQVIKSLSGETSTVVFRFKRRQLSCTLHPVFEKEGVQELVGFLDDVSEIRKTERKLMLFAHTLASLNEAVSVTDSEDNILYVNPAFCRLYGYSEEEVLNKPSNILWSKKNPEEVTEPILKDTLNGGWKGQLFNKNAQGEHFMIALQTSAVLDTNGEIIGCVGMATRISDDSEVGKFTKGRLLWEQPPMSLAANPNSSASESLLAQPIEVLQTHFSDTFVLQNVNKTSNSNLVWFSENLDLALLGFVDCEVDDPFAPYNCLMISGMLDQLVNKNMICLPDHVLEKIHRQIYPLLNISKLNNNNTSQINLGICSITRKGSTFRFAGAAIKLLYVCADRVRVAKGNDEGLVNSEANENRYFPVFNRAIQEGDSIYIPNSSFLRSISESDHAEDGLEVLKEWLEACKNLAFSEHELFIKAKTDALWNESNAETNPSAILLGIAL